MNGYWKFLIIYGLNGAQLSPVILHNVMDSVIVINAARRMALTLTFYDHSARDLLNDLQEILLHNHRLHNLFKFTVYEKK